jgi:hypothetical protein
MVTVTIEKDETSQDYKLPLPEKTLQEMGWQEGDTLSVTKVNRTIHMSKVLEDI